MTMFKIILPVILLVSINSFAQNTNLFPPTGNLAGLGTVNPENSEGWQTAFEVKGAASSKSLTSTNGIITGTWSHSLGYYGAPAGGISGTFTNHPYSFMTNSAARMIIANNGYVGIGTMAPSDLLHLDAGDTRKGITITSQGNADAYADINFGIKNSSSIPTGRPILWVMSHRKDGFFSNSDGIGSSLEFYAYNSGGTYFAPLSFKSNGDVVLISDKNTIGGGNVSIGTTDAKGYKLAVNGSVIATSMTVKLNAAWPDYVFEKDYSLLSLNELEQYLLKNKHLPDMPSAKEIETTGQNLGQINSKLVKNVEELTLHLIEKDKQLQQQQKMIDLQNQRIEKLESSLTEIMKKIK